MIDYNLLLQSLALGFVVGFIFTMAKLPIPAPDNWYAVIGIVGLLLGSIVVTQYKFYVF